MDLKYCSSSPSPDELENLLNIAISTETRGDEASTSPFYDVAWTLPITFRAATEVSATTMRKNMREEYHTEVELKNACLIALSSVLDCHVVCQSHAERQSQQETP